LRASHRARGRPPLVPVPLLMEGIDRMRGPRPGAPGGPHGACAAGRRPAPPTPHRPRGRATPAWSPL